MNNHHKNPLLTLTLSSSSFLDATVFDDAQNHALYTINTLGSSTTMTRAHKPEGSSIKVLDVRWPMAAPMKGKRKDISVGVLVQIKGGRWTNGENLLSPPNLLRHHKFHVPGYSHGLKWKRLGGSYHCITGPVKGPIAILETAIASHGARLLVFETMHDKYDPSALSVYSGVSTILLDYLISTALLLVTNPKEWSLLSSATAHNTSSDQPPILQAITDLTGMNRRSTSLPSRQWRKVFGDQLFSPTLRPDEIGRTISAETTAEQIAKVVYGKPLFPKMRSLAQTSDPGMASDRGDEDDLDSDIDHHELFQYLTSQNRPWATPQHLSPSAESSTCGLPSTDDAPSHTYLDPSFYSAPNQDNVKAPTRPYFSRDLSISSSDQSDTSPNSMVSPTSLRRLPPLPNSRSDANRTTARRALTATSSPFPAHIHPGPLNASTSALVSDRSHSTPPGGPQVSSPTSMVSQQATSRRLSFSAVGRPKALPPVPSMPSLRPNTAQQQSFQLSAPPQRTLSRRDLPRPPQHHASPPNSSALQNRTLVLDAGSLPALYDIPALPKGREASLELEKLYFQAETNWPVSTSPAPRDTVFELPPPAYHSINFCMPSPVVGSASLPLFPPAPIADAGAHTLRHFDARPGLPSPPSHSPLFQNSCSS